MQEMTPLPGDPSALLAEANQLSNSAAQIQHAIDNLKKLADRDETISEAVDAVRGKARDVGSAITKAHTRYSGTAAALQEYAPRLDAAQLRAQRAIAAYGQADSQLQHAQHHQSVAQHNYQPSDPSAATSEYARLREFAHSSAGIRAQHAIDDARDALSAAQEEWWAAFNDMVSAAKHAASLIVDAVNDSHLNDGFWDKVGEAWDGFAAWAKKYLGPILDILQKIAEQVANIAGILAMVFAVLAVFFPALAGIAGLFATIAMVASLVSFACTLVLALMGDRGWGDVLATGIVAVLSVIGAGKLGKLIPVDLAGKVSKFAPSEAAGKFGQWAGGKLGTVLGDGIAVRAAGAAAEEAGAQGASFANQSIVADLIRGDVLRTIAERSAGVSSELIKFTTDVVMDSATGNLGGAVDSAMGYHEPDGLWTAPPSFTPKVDFFGDAGESPLELGGLDPVQLYRDQVESVESFVDVSAAYVTGSVATSGVRN